MSKFLPGSKSDASVSGLGWGGAAEQAICRLLKTPAVLKTAETLRGLSLDIACRRLEGLKQQLPWIRSPRKSETMAWFLFRTTGALTILMVSPIFF